MIKAFGFSADSEQAIPLTDVSISFSIEALRDFSQFVAHALSEMERLGSNYDHVHYCDFSEKWERNWPDIQLTKIFK